MIRQMQRIWSGLQYWYFRYTLSTELYMVEKWERCFINLFFITTFLCFFLFNYKVVLPVTENLLSY